jgi:hypothetical protein
MYSTLGRFSGRNSGVFLVLHLRCILYFRLRLFPLLGKEFRFSVHDYLLPNRGCVCIMQ